MEGDGPVVRPVEGLANQSNQLEEAWFPSLLSGSLYWFVLELC